MTLKEVLAAAGFAGALVGASIMFYDCGHRSADGKVSELSQQLAENEKTIEIKDGLFATELTGMADLKSLLDGSKREISELVDQLNSSKAELLATQQVVLKWKKAYEAEAAANQSQQPPVNPGDPVRKRIDFTHDFGPFLVAGYTLTDPAFADIKVTQGRPLTLTVNVARNPDGKWVSYVTSSEKDIDAEVKLGGVDTGILDPSWYQRLWLEGSADEIVGRRAGLGLSYHFDRTEIGIECSTWQGGHGCGVTAGYRIFK